MANLRNYNGAQRRIVEASKKAVLVQTKFKKVNGSDFQLTKFPELHK